MAEANQVLARFLPEYNRRFAVAPQDNSMAYRKLPLGFQPEEYFCFKYERTVANDNVVRYKGYRLQVLPSSTRAGYARCKVTVHLGLNHSLTVYYQGKCLKTRPAPVEATALRRSFSNLPVTGSDMPKSAIARLPVKPSPDHPWRGKYRVHFD